MPVIDASVMVDALVAVGAHGDVARNALRRQQILAVPSIFSAEVTSALRSLVLRGELDQPRAAAARAQLGTLATVQFPFEPFSQRVWDLRASVSVYDGWYVALAESLDTDLITVDERLARAAGPRCAINLLRPA